MIANSTPPVHDPGPGTQREAALPGYQEGHLEDVTRAPELPDERTEAREDVEEAEPKEVKPPGELTAEELEAKLELEEEEEEDEDDEDEEG